MTDRFRSHNFFTCLPAINTYRRLDLFHFLIEKRKFWKCKLFFNNIQLFSIESPYLAVLAEQRRFHENITLVAIAALCSTPF